MCCEDENYWEQRPHIYGKFFCHKCGFEVHTPTNFCGNCGKSMKAVKNRSLSIPISAYRDK